MATNPYLSDQANAITNQVTGNLQNRVLPNLNMGSAATGNFGSNRHMIAQGQAIGDTNPDCPDERRDPAPGVAEPVQPWHG